MKKYFYNQYLIILFILFLGLFLRLLYLNEIPAEMWGDVNMHFQYAKNILSGNLIYEYWGGDGPILAYIIAIFFKLLNVSFLSLKLASVFIGVLTIWVNYLFSFELSKKKSIAYISSFLMAVSFWSITFSRQGKPYILVPLFLLLVLYFSLKKKWVLAGISLGLGMYSQAAFWGFFVFAFFNIPLLLFSTLMALPFFYQIYKNPNNFFNTGSYVGEKFGFNLELKTKFIRLLTNIFKNIQSFWINGDIVFRANIPMHPNLDRLSGVLFIIGIFFIVRQIITKKNRSFFIFLIIPFFLIQISSILDINNPLNTPAMGRMVGVTPIVYFIISYAIFTLYNFLTKKIKHLYSTFILIVFLFVIFIINFYNYFFIYPKTLPNNNTPFGYVIAQDINENIFMKNIFVVGCCWGDWGQPEPDSITNRLFPNNNHVEFLDEANFINKSCNFFKTQYMKQTTLYLNPENPLLISKIKSCFSQYEEKLIKKNNYSVVRKIVINN